MSEVRRAAGLPTSGVIADELRRRIVSGALGPGDQLGEVALAEELGVSRGPVREAMQRLIQEGLLVAERFRGVFVVSLGPGDVADINLARWAIERAAALRVVRRGEPAAVARLGRLVGEMAKAAGGPRRSWERLADLDLSFHEALVAASDSPRLARAHGTLAAETRICLAALEPDYPDWTEIVAEHERLVAALGAGDEELVLATLDEHLRATT